MKDISTTFIRTTCGKPFNLRKAAPLASNAKAPYGCHNFVIYKTTNGFYVKACNSGTASKLVNTFELISRNEAMQHLQAQTTGTPFNLVYR